MRAAFRVFALAMAVALVLFAARPAAADETVILKTRGEVTQSFVLIAPAKPAAAMILFAGGAGKLPLDKLTPTAFLDRGNFLVRSRHAFARHGFAVAVVDSPSDQPGGMLGGFRGSAAHETDVAAVVEHLKAKWPVGVWLVGTSRGTESAAFLATKLGDRIAGIVLTSTMAVRNAKGFSVFEFPLGTIRVPALAVAHKSDGCAFTPPSEATRIVNALTASPRKQALFFEGGAEPKSDACGPLSPHGFFGIEEKVVAAIAAFIGGR